MSYASICNDRLEYFPKRSASPSTTISDIGGYFTDLVHLPGNWIIEHYWTYDIANILGEAVSWLQYLDVVPAEHPALAIGLGSFDAVVG